MRFDLVVDSLSVLGSLWGGTVSRLCPARPDVVLGVAREATKPSVVAMAFVDVNVVPMDTERVLAHQTVLIEGGRITAVGPVDQVQVPVGAVRVDGRGKYLMPGLGHGHDHETWLSFKEIVVKGDTVVASPQQLHALARNLAEGITTVAVPGGFTQLPAVLRFLKTVPSPRFYFTTGVPRRIRKQGLDSMAAFIAVQKAAGYTQVGGVGQEDSLLAAAASRGGLPMTWHAHQNRFNAVLVLGASGGNVDHLQFYEDSIVLGLASDGGAAEGAWQRMQPDTLLRKIQSLAAALQRAGVWVTPTLRCEMGFAGYLPASDAKVSDPLNVFLVKFKLQFTKVLHDTGVRLLLSADDSWSPHEELTAFVQAGLTPYQALVAGTRNMAQYGGQLDSAGTIAVGKRADLVLLDRNPLQDVRNAREPVGVAAAGRWLDRTALDHLLLADPKLWIQWVLRERGGVATFTKHGDGEETLGRVAGKQHRAQLLVFMDSLQITQAKPKEYERIAQAFAKELGALRALLPPEQQREWLDPAARVWLREQGRKGNSLVVPGVVLQP